MAIAGVIEFEKVPRTDGFISAEFTNLATHLASIPLRIFHGELDREVSVTQSRRLFAELKKIDSPVSYTEYAGTAHGPGAEKAYADQELWAWLSKQRRQPK